MGIKLSLSSSSSTHIPPRTLIWCKRTWISALEASITQAGIRGYSLHKKELWAPRRRSSSSFPIWMLKMGRGIANSSAAAWSTRERAGNLRGKIKSNQSDRPCKVNSKGHPLETWKAWSACALRRVSKPHLTLIKPIRLTYRKLMRPAWPSCRKALVSINLPARPIIGSIPLISPHPSEGRSSCSSRISRDECKTSRLCRLMMNVSRAPPRLEIHHFPAIPTSQTE